MGDDTSRLDIREGFFPCDGVHFDVPQVEVGVLFALLGCNGDQDIEGRGRGCDRDLYPGQSLIVVDDSIVLCSFLKLAVRRTICAVAVNISVMVVGEKWS